MYVSAHQAYSERNSDGWPKGLAKHEQEWLVAKCLAMLSERGPMSTWDVYQYIRDYPDCPKIGPIITYALACVDRALREHAKEVWTL